MTAYPYTLQDALSTLEKLGCNPKPNGNGYTACCPVHEADGKSHTPSLSVAPGDKVPFVVHCHAGCDPKSILAALGLNKPRDSSSRKIVAVYPYHDASGKVVSEKVRYEPKDFRQRWPDGIGGYLWKKPKGAPAVLYRLHELREGIAAGRDIFMVEGEKDVDRLVEHWLHTTTTIEGASKDIYKQKWRKDYTAQMTGAVRVVLLPDNDDAGRAHMLNIAKELQGKVGELRWLELPGLPEKGDVSDWLDQGHTVDELVALIAQASAPPIDNDPPDNDAADEHPERFVRPATVQVVAGGLPEATDEAEAALIQHGAGIYQRSGYLCRINHQQAATVRGITRPRGAVGIAPLDRDATLDKMNRTIRFEKWNEKAEKYKRCHAPAAVAMTLLARSGAWNFPPLIGVISAPTLRPDGSILEKPGYDPETGLFFDIQKESFPPIPAAPSLADGQQAIRFLDDELLRRPCLNSDRPEDQGFSFAQPSDRSAALAALLTALVRPSLPTAPIFLKRATRPGSAKTLLADIPALVATGRPATIFELGADADEVEKRMLSVLLAGDSVVNLDNLEVPLGGATLCKVLSGETITGRLLGFNKTATVPTAALFMATGNNIQVVGDMTRRVVVINLDPQSEAPENRQYDRNLMTWIPENRPRLVQAGLTALRAYIVAGRPRQTPWLMGSFEDWDTTIRQALIWLGEDDPLAGTAQLESADPVRCKLRALLIAWYATFRSAGATSKEAISHAKETQRNNEGDEERPFQALWDVLSEHFTDRRGEVRSQLIGEFIRKNDRRVEIGARFEEKGNYNNAQVWRVVIVDEKRFQKILAGMEQGNKGNKGNSQCDQASYDPYDPYYPKTPHHKNLGASFPDDLGESGESGESITPRSEILGENFSASPPATRILEILSDAPGGMELADLIKTVGNAKGTSGPMVEMTVNQMLLSGQLGKVNGRLVVNR